MSLLDRGRHFSAFTGVSLLALMAAPALGQQSAPTTILAPSGATVLERLVVGSGTIDQAPPTGTIGQPMAPYAGGQVATGARLGVLGNQSIFSAPFSVTGFTQELIQNQQARTIGDIALNDPSVRNDAPPFSERDAFFIRGFSVTNLDTAFDGLFYLNNPRRSFLEGIERVEILKGPTALLNGGVGRIGGTINLIPKRATSEPLTRLTTTYASNSQLWSHLDVGRRFGTNDEWGIRLNGSYRNGQTPFENNQAEVGVASLGLDYRGEKLRASLDLSHSNQHIDAPTSLFNSVAPGVPIPRAPDGRINLSSPFEYHASTYNMAAARVEYDILENTTIYAAGGLSRYREDFLTSSHRIINANGDAEGTLAIQPQQLQGFSGEVGLRSEFDTGPVGHQFDVSVSRALNENYRGGFNPRLLGLPATYPTNIYDPVYLPDGSVDTGSLPRSDDLPLFANLLATSVAVSDTLSFADERLQLTLGGRYQSIRSEGFNTRPDIGPIGQTNYLYDEGRFTPAIGVMAHVTDQLSVYANYVEALTEGPTAPAVATNSGEMFAPVVNRQREIGVKYDAGSYGVTAALFEIEQPNGFTAPGGAFSLSGLQVNRGLELSVFGEPFEGFRLLGGVTFMDAELASTAGGLNDGNRVTGVPQTAFNLYGEYDLPWITPGLTMTGRLIYSGDTFYDQANTQEVSDWTRVDLGVRYEVEGPYGTPIELKANIENVFDESYWASSARGFLAAGAPRTFKVSASFEF